MWKKLTAMLLLAITLTFCGGCAAMFETSNNPGAKGAAQVGSAVRAGRIIGWF